MSQSAGTTFHSNGRRKFKNAPIILVNGDKGGVGKSFLSRVTVGWLLKRGETVFGFDGDSRNAHLERFYGSAAHDSTTKIMIDRAMLRSVVGWSEMYSSWDLQSATVILVDLPGNIGDMLESEAERLSRIAEALDRRIISLWAASEEEDSVWLFKRVLRVVPAEQTLFVMNGRFGDTPAKFELWQQSKTRAEFIAKGGNETLLPVLPILPRTAIAQSRSPFHDVGGAGLTLTGKVDFDMWWEAIEVALVPLAKMLEAA